MRIQQRALHEQLRVEGGATREKIAALMRPLDAAQVNEHPEPEGWSVARAARTSSSPTSATSSRCSSQGR